MLGLGATALGIATMLPGLANTWTQYDAQQDNLAEQKKWNAYNTWLQQSIFGREDTSILRRVADLRSAGLSPVLAAGQGAGTGGAIPISGAKKDAINIGAMTQEALNAMSMLKMDADISQTVAQENLIKMQARQVNAQTSKTLADASQAWHDYDYFKTTQQPSTGQGTMAKEIAGLLGLSGSDGIKNLLKVIYGGSEEKPARTMTEQEMLNILRKTNQKATPKHPNNKTSNF